MIFLRAAAAALVLLPLAATAQTARDRSSGLGTLGSNKEPIKIDADRLDVFDRDGKAVFEGNVVAVQGDSTVKCTSLTVLYEQRGQGGQRATQASAAAPTDGAIKKIDCKGPVTIVNKTQTATGDNASFDRVANRVFLTGNVLLSEGQNLTRGERLVYDLNTGVANIETGPGGRVRAMFTPGGSDNPAPAPAPAAAPAPRPTATPPVPRPAPQAAPAPRAAQPPTAQRPMPLGPAPVR